MSKTDSAHNGNLLKPKNIISPCSSSKTWILNFFIRWNLPNVETDRKNLPNSSNTLSPSRQIADFITRQDRINVACTLLVFKLHLFGLYLRRDTRIVSPPMRFVKNSTWNGGDAKRCKSLQVSASVPQYTFAFALSHPYSANVYCRHKTEKPKLISLKKFCSYPTSTP